MPSQKLTIYPEQPPTVEELKKYAQDMINLTQCQIIPICHKDGAKKPIGTHAMNAAWDAYNKKIDWTNATGYGVKVANRLVVIDYDDIHDIDPFEEFIGLEFPETFTVSTSRGIHKYYFGHIPDWFTKKNYRPKFDVEVFCNQSNSFVVGPGSWHTDAEKYYQIIKDVPIASIEGWDEWQPKVYSASGNILDEYTEVTGRVVDPSYASSEGELLLRCPRYDHEDKKASFSLNILKEVFHCHGCGISGGRDGLSIADIADKRAAEFVASIKESYYSTEDLSSNIIEVELDHWAKTDKLRNLEQYFHSGGASANAGLGVTLALVASKIPYEYRIPPIRFKRVYPISLFNYLMGPSGAGKTGTIYMAEYAIQSDHTNTGEFDEMKGPFPITDPSSGEFILDQFLMKDKTTRIEWKTNALVSIEEMAGYLKKCDAPSAQLDVTMRKLWAGSDAAAGASHSGTRFLKGNTYSVSAIAGAQEDIAYDLSNRTAGGDAQRWLAFDTHDSRLPEVEDEPDEPEGFQINIWPKPIPNGELVELTVDPDIVLSCKKRYRNINENRPHNYGLNDWEGIGEEAHIQITRLSLSAVLACIHDYPPDNKPYVIDKKMWELAGLILAHCEQTRLKAIEAGSASEHRDMVERAKKAGEFKRISEDHPKKRQDIFNRVYSRLVAAFANKKETVEMTASQLEMKIAGRDRKSYKYKSVTLIDDIMEKLLDDEIVTEIGINRQDNPIYRFK